MIDKKTLTVFCDGGLANRLRVLLSGMAAADISQRKFKMYWPRTPACAASFRELFKNNWPVQDVEQIEPSLLVHKVPSGSPCSSIQQIVSDPGKDIVIGSYFWIVDCQLRRYPDMYAICSRLLRELEPQPEIEKQITKTKKLFRP